jgi:DNA-binding NarL/FixJ family response regulator
MSNKPVTVLAAVDDLLFSSKIRAAAEPLGVSVTFARTPDAVFTAAQSTPARLVIVDLDSQRLQPMDVIATLKAAMPSVPIVGFVSHVRTDRIEAARAAGADEVLARSAFTARLTEILSAAAPPA